MPAPPTRPAPSRAKRNALILALGTVFPILALSALFLFKSSSLKRSVAEPAIFTAQASPQVAALIGLPIQPGWPIRGKVLSKKGNGNADLQIPLNGSHATGTLTEWAQQTKGKWHLCSLQFTADSKIPLTLIDPANTHCQPE